MNICYFKKFGIFLFYKLDLGFCRNVSNVHEAWFANEDEVRKAVGLLDKIDIKPPKAGEVC